jgi:hypothetical protein
MDDFRKYSQMKDAGCSPGQVYSTAKADSLDEITVIGLLRRVFNLSLAEAKQVAGQAQATSAKQEVRVGGEVYWEGWSTEEGFYLIQAKVVRITGEYAELQEHKKFRITNTGLEELPEVSIPPASLKVSYLERSLTDRLGELLKFVDSLSAVAHEPVKRHEKKAV